MRAIATKQPTNDSSQQKKKGNSVRSHSISSLSRGMPLLQRKCACGGGCPRCKEDLGIQTKLKIGKPGGKYEQEADRIADEVMRMPELSVQRQVELEQEDLLQKKTATGSLPTISPHLGSSIHTPQGGGQPLPKSVRTYFEPRFGHNFDQVRIHTDGIAAESAQSINAKAYTIGQDIVFGAGQYEPSTNKGQKLLAHELTHTIQQRFLDGSIARQLQNPTEEEQLRILIQTRLKQNPRKLIKRVGKASSLGAFAFLEFQEEIVTTGKNIYVFFRCLFQEISQTKLPNFLDILMQENNLSRSVANISSDFIEGVIKGIAQDLKETISFLKNIVENPEKFLKSIAGIISLMITPEGKEVTCALGGDMGEQFANQISALSEKSLNEIVYGLGKLAGPLILGALLGILTSGVGWFANAIKGLKIIFKQSKRLLKILKKFPDLFPGLRPKSRGGEGQGEFPEQERTFANQLLGTEDFEVPEGFDEVRERPNIRTSFGSGSGPLGKALERDIPSRPKPAPGYEAHHIIPHGEIDPIAVQLRFYLSFRRIGIDETANGAWLPRGRKTPVIPGTNPILHDFTMGAGLQEYLEALQQIFLVQNPTASASKVRSILRSIGQQLENGIFPPEYHP